MKIRLKLFLAFALSGLLLTVSGVYVHHRFAADALKKEAFLRVQAVSDSKKNLVDYYLDSLKQQTVLIQSKTQMNKDFYDLQQTEDEIIRQNLIINLENVLAGDKEYKDIYLLDNSGIVLASTRENIGDDMSRNTNFIFGRDLVGISEIVKIGNERIFYLYGPLFYMGQQTGVIIIEKQASELEEIVSSTIGFGETGVVKIVNENRYEVVTSNKIFLNLQLQTQNVEDCFNDANNIFDENQIPSILVNSSGKKIIASHSYIPSMKWCLITEIEESEVLRPINKMFLFAILLMFSLLASVFVIAIIIGKKIASPIEKLKKSVEKITNGQIDARVAIDGNDEIGSLSRAIDSMTDSIKKSKSEIEEKVKEQTSSILEKQKQMQDQQTAMVNILEDVEVEKKQNALERDKLGTILLGIGDAVMVLDTDRRIQLFNKTAENISGFTASEVIGKKCFEVLNFIYEDTGKQNTDFVDGALLHGSVVKMKNHTLLVRKDGNKVPVADSAAPLKSDSGQIIGCVVVFRDVEEEREIDRMKTEFVSVASHQLRTPLTGVKWHLEVMLDDATGLSPDQLDGLREAYDSNERMIKLVNDLLDVSRIETGRKFDIKKQPSDMIKIVESVIRDNIALAEKKKINIIKCADAPESFILQVDPDKVSQVFQNLISNAIKYSHDNSTVEIGCEHNEKDVVIYVKDSGIGIPEKDQKNIFGKFFRAENATSIQADGNGLGLYIAKSIVEAHGGKIWFESILEKGTTFYFTLPMNTPKSKKVDEDIKA